MKNLVNKGFKYFVAIMMVFSLMSMNAWANGPESGTSSETGSTTTENKGTTKDTGDSQGDTADQLISNEEKKTTTSKESDDKEGQTDQTTDKKIDYTYEDKKISVKAVLANASAISDQAELRVKEIPESTTEYKKYQEALNKKSNLYSNVLLYDISFILDGKEVEPTDGNVKVSISFKDQQLSDDLNVKDNNDLKVIHFKDNDVNKQESLKTTTSVKNETTSFETKSFSAYAVVTENGTKKNVYTVNNFQVPDYGYGVTANNYYQEGDTESNIFVGNYYSTASEVGASARFSDTGGQYYIGDFKNNETGFNSLVRFHSKPANVYLGDNAYTKYTNNNVSFDTNWVDTNIIVHRNMNVQAQLDKMDAAYSSIKEMNIPDSISSITSNNTVEIDLSSKGPGTYVVKFDGNKIEDNKLTVKINEGQHLIFYCTTNGVLDIQRYLLDTKTNGDTQRIEGQCSKFVDLEAQIGGANEDNKKYDWVNKAVSFYAPHSTELKFTNDEVCGVFIAKNASFTEANNANAGIIAVNNYGTSDHKIGREWHYHNHDLPTPSDVQFEGLKQFANESWPKSGSYKLKLTAINNSTLSAEGKTLELSNDKKSGKFDKITYSATTDSNLYNKTKFFYYKIEELSDNTVANVTYDTTVYYIKVKVSYSANGSATVTEMYKTKSNPFDSNGKERDGIEWTRFEEIDPFVFTNTYNTFSAKASLEIKKTVNGLAPGNKTFEFNLDEGSPGSDGKFIRSNKVQENATNDINGNVTFNELNYTEAGTHYYMISEKDDANYVSSGNIYVKVDVRKSADGKKLKTDVSYYKDPKFNEKIDVSGTNKPTINNTSVKFVLKKTDAEDNSKTLSNAKFTLQKLNSLNKNTNTLEIGDNVTSEPVSTDDSGLATFNNLSKNKSYLLTETKAPDGYQTSGPWLLEITDEGHMTLTKLTKYEAVKGKDNTFNYVKSTDSNDIKEQDAVKIRSEPIGIGDKKIEYTLPSTGGTGTMKYYLLGTLLSMLGVIYIVMKLGKGGLFGKEDHS